jgi:hypothetical protein
MVWTASRIDMATARSETGNDQLKKSEQSSIQVGDRGSAMRKDSAGRDGQEAVHAQCGAFQSQSEER